MERVANKIMNQQILLLKNINFYYTEILKRSAAFIITIFCVCNICQSQKLNNRISDTLLIWQNDRPLTLDDFKSNQRIEGYSANSSLNTIFESKFLPDGTYRITIKAAFFTNQAWSIPNMSPILLMHEQVHFNITELAARKMREFLSAKIVNNSNYDSVVENLHSIKRLVDEKDAKYDVETLHGRKIDIQYEWKTKIDTELFELRNYELRDGLELYKYRDFIKPKPPSDSVLEWQPKSKIKWSDFKQREKSLYNSSVTNLNTDIVLNAEPLPSQKYKLIITAYFFPYKSLATPNQSSALLLHEQVNFNITELIARKMRASIRDIEIDNNNLNDLIWKIVTLKKELKTLIAKHGRETSYGKQNVRQAEWQKKVEAQLNALKEYELKGGVELYKISKNRK